MGPHGMHPRVLRELVDVITRLFSMLFEQPWQLGEMCEDWERANVTSIFKEDPGTTRQSASPEGDEQLILETTSRYTKNKKVTGSDQHSFTKCKSFLTNMITFYDEMTGLIDGEQWILSTLTLVGPLTLSPVRSSWRGS